MTKVGQSFEAWARNTKRVKITVYNENGAIYDLTGVQEITWILKNVPEDTTALVTKTKTGGTVVVGSPATSGFFTVFLEPTDLNRRAGSYYHEAKLIDSVGRQQTVTVGYVVLHASGVT